MSTTTTRPTAVESPEQLIIRPNRERVIVSRQRELIGIGSRYSAGGRRFPPHQLSQHSISEILGSLQSAFFAEYGQQPQIAPIQI